MYIYGYLSIHLYIYGYVSIHKYKSINIIKTNRGGKITYHCTGQLICYFVIYLKKRKKDIRNFISSIEKTIIDTLNEYNIKTFADKKNIGIWYHKNNEINLLHNTQ